jgi:hypothetical protein
MNKCSYQPHPESVNSRKTDGFMDLFVLAAFDMSSPRLALLALFDMLICLA